ncbi:MAG: hypothetical protein HY870_02440 [Chloroflexi bacterium]|nr:hypothetical protein [Chloroflexota bacterium]
MVATPTRSLSLDQIAKYTLELSATVAALLPPPPTPDASGYAPLTLEGVSVWPLTTTNGAELWVVYSYGMRDFIANHNHFIAIYSRTNDDWQLLLKFDLTNADYVDPGSVRQVLIEPTHIWLSVDSGVGAHGGCFDLFAVDPSGRSQIEAAANCSDHPGAGEVRDLNGDGQLDVILDHTNSYVFCYACGVRLPAFSVLRWDGTQLIEQPLTPLPASAPTNVRDYNNRAVELANAGLWKDAQATIDLVTTSDPIARWNAALTALYSQAWRDQISYQPYPLLDNLFYGDYAATLDVMHPYTPDQLFSLTGPLIAGTMAEGWESTLADWITQTTNSAIQVQPDLAAAYFLRGYGAWLADQTNPAALADVEKAAQLAPNEKLFSDSVEFFEVRPIKGER